MVIYTKKVKARMLMLELTQPIMARQMGMNTATINAKLNNKRRLYVDEYLKLCDILELNTAEERRELLGVALILPQESLFSDTKAEPDEKKRCLN